MNSIKNILSQRMDHIDTSEIRRVFQLAATLKNPINLSIGQPHFSTPAPITEAISDALQAGHTGYSITQGIQPLREKLAEKWSRQNNIETSADNVLVSSGVSSLIQLLFQATLDPGDRVLITDPCFLIYRSMLSFLGARIETIPETFSEENLKDIDWNGIKLVIFCSPSNPTGHVMSRKQIDLLGRYASKSGSILVADEIYEVFDYDGQFISAASLYPNTITLMGFSKSYSMTGLRLSAATGPREIISAMTTLQQYTVVCAPVPIQYGGLAALDLDMTPYVDDYRKKRDLVRASLQDCCTFVEPQGAFYVFAKIPGEDRAFVERAIKEKELLVVPGRIFTDRTDYIRISYATKDEILEKGLQCLRELIENS